MQKSCIKCKEYFLTTKLIQLTVCFDCVLEIVAPDLTEEAKMYDDYFFVEQTDKKCDKCFCNADGWKWTSFTEMYMFTCCLDCINSCCADLINND